MASRRGFTRRDFLKLSGVGLAGATLASCERLTKVRVTAIPAAGPSITPMPPLGPGETADAVLFNGNIVTMDARRSKVSALAIKNGLIRIVGDEQAARAIAGDTTQLIDLRGRTVTPGLIDAHCHLSACGLLGTAYLDVSWPGIKTVEALQAKVAEKVATTPKGQWIAGSGWVTFGGRYPTKHDLDPVSPVRLIEIPGLPMESGPPGRPWGTCSIHPFFRVVPPCCRALQEKGVLAGAGIRNALTLECAKQHGVELTRSAWFQRS